MLYINCDWKSYVRIQHIMKKILVTGASGFIGSNLCEKLISLGYTVFGIDDLSSSSIENLDLIIKNKNFRFIKADAAAINFKSIPEKIDTIIHLSAAKIPRYGNRISTLLINTESTKNMLEFAKKSKAKFIFGSTSDVYGKNPKLPFKEDSDLVLGSSDVARWAYAASKIFDEHLCFAYWEEYKIPFTILRFFNVYGPRQTRNWNGGPASLFTDALLQGKEIEIHGTGKQIRAFSFIDDIVEAIIKSINHKKAIGQIINLGSMEKISIIDFAKLISKFAGNKLKIKKVSYQSFTGKPYQDVIFRQPDIKKAKNTLGWAPTTSLTEGLKKTIEWHKQNPI